MTHPAVFLDRDGVLSRALVVDGQPATPMRAAEFEVLPDVARICRSLHDDGFLLVVVTNQPDIARGLLPPAELSLMHAILKAQVPLDDIGVCPHDDADGCSCRKPAPGMLFDAAREHGIDLAASFLVGDRWRDIEAGRRAGCRTILIDHHWQEQLPEGADAVVSDLAGAALWIRNHAKLQQGAA